MLVGLGAFHGLNPAMGWLFAVARGLQHGSRAVVLQSMLPIAAGHAVSIGMVVAAVGLLRPWLQIEPLQAGCAVTLIGFGAYRLFARHRARVGMQVGATQLALWSFLMATADGAGLMLVPALLAIPLDGGNAGHGHMATMDVVPASTTTALAAVGAHTAAMLVISTAAAVLVYEWVGLAFLRRGWINFELLWAAALIGTGGILLVAR
jgi:hypothetical protein